MTRRAKSAKDVETSCDTRSDGAQEPSFDLQAHIGRLIKEMFEEVVAQPIPDKLLKIIQELEAKQPKR
jgi:hypothetical protein